MFIKIDDVWNGWQKLTYSGYFLQSAEVSCTDMGRKAGGRRGVGGAGKGGGSRGKTSSSGGGASSGGSSSGSSSSGSGSGSGTGGSGTGSSGTGGSGGHRTSTQKFSASQPSTPTFTVSADAGQNVSWGTMTTVGGYNPSDYSSVQVKRAMEDTGESSVTPAQIAESDKAFKKKEFERGQAAIQAQQEKKRAEQLAGVQPAWHASQTGDLAKAISESKTAHPQAWGTALSGTPSGQLRTDAVSSDKPSRDNVFGIGDSAYKTESQQDLAASTQQFDFGISTTPQDIIPTYQPSESIDFWGTQQRDLMGEQEAMTEKTLQLALASTRINNTQAEIDARHNEIKDLQAVLDSERARIVQTEDAGFDSWSTADLYSESSLYQSTEERISNLEAEIGRLEGTLSIEQAKYDKWSGKDVTEEAAAAFTGGIMQPMDPNAFNPMETPQDITTPVEKGTLEYQDITPDIDDVIQKPDKDNVFKDESFIQSVFGDLKLPFTLPYAEATEDPDIGTLTYESQLDPSSVHYDPNVFKAETLKTTTPSTEAYNIAKEVGMPTTTEADLKAIVERYDNTETGEQNKRADLLKHGKENLALSTMYVTATETDADMDKEIRDFAKEHGYTPAEAAEKYNSYVTDELGVGQELVFSPKPYTMQGDFQAIFDEYQAKAPEGMTFTGMDDWGQPQYGEYGKSWFEVGDTGTMERQWQAVDMSSDEGKKLQAGLISGAKADYFNALQAERFSDFKAGKYSMTEFLKYSGGDPKLTAIYMKERGLSMDAPMGSMVIGADRVQKGGQLIYGKESVPVYQTYMENKMTGGDFSQAEQLATLKKEDPAAYARLEEQARRQAGDVQQDDGTWTTKMHDVIKTIPRADERAAAIPESFGEYGMDVGTPDYLKETLIEDYQPAVDAVTSPYVRDDAMYDDPLLRAGVGMTTLAKDARGAPIYQQSAAGFYGDVIGNILAEHPTDDQFKIMWKQDQNLSDTGAEEELAIWVSREELLSTVIAGVQAGKVPIDIYSEGMQYPRESPARFDAYLKQVTLYDTLPSAAQKLSDADRRLVEIGAFDLAHFGITEFDSGDREFYIQNGRLTEAGTLDLVSQGLLVTRDEWEKQYAELDTDDAYLRYQLAQKMEHGTATVAEAEEWQRILDKYVEGGDIIPEPERVPTVFGMQGGERVATAGALPRLDEFFDYVSSPDAPSWMTFAGKLLAAPMTTLFDTGTVVTPLGQRAMDEGRVAPPPVSTQDFWTGEFVPHPEWQGSSMVSGFGIQGMTYHEAAMAGYIDPKAEGFIGDLKMAASISLFPATQFVRIIGTLGAAGGLDLYGTGDTKQTWTTPDILQKRMVTFMGEEAAAKGGIPKFAMYDHTALELSFGAVAEGLTHSVKVGMGYDPDAIDPTTGKKVIEERPLVTLKEGTFDWTGTVDPTTGEQQAWGRGVAEREDQGTWNELVQTLAKDPLKYAMQVPMEAAIMILPLRVKGAVLAAATHSARITSETARRILPQTAHDIAKAQLGKSLSAIEGWGSNVAASPATLKQTLKMIAKDKNVTESGSTYQDIAYAKHVIQKAKPAAKQPEMEKMSQSVFKKQLSELTPEQYLTIENRYMSTYGKYASEKVFVETASTAMDAGRRAKIFGTVKPVGADALEQSASSFGRFAFTQRFQQIWRGAGQYAEVGAVEQGAKTPTYAYARVADVPMKRVFSGGTPTGRKIGGTLQRIAQFTPDKMEDYLKGGWMYNWKSWSAGEMIHKSQFQKFLERRYEALPETAKVALSPVGAAAEALHLTISPSARMIKFVDDTVTAGGVHKFENTQLGQQILKHLKLKKFEYKTDAQGNIKYRKDPLTGEFILKNGKKQPIIDYKKFHTKWTVKTEYTQLRQQLGIKMSTMADAPPIMRATLMGDAFIPKITEGVPKTELLPVALPRVLGGAPWRMAPVKIREGGMDIMPKGYFAKDVVKKETYDQISTRLYGITYKKAKGWWKQESKAEISWRLHKEVLKKLTPAQRKVVDAEFAKGKKVWRAGEVGKAELARIEAEYAAQTPFREATTRNVLAKKLFGKTTNLSTAQKAQLDTAVAASKMKVREWKWYPDTEGQVQTITDASGNEILKFTTGGAAKYGLVPPRQVVPAGEDIGLRNIPQFGSMMSGDLTGGVSITSTTLFWENMPRMARSERLNLEGVGFHPSGMWRTSQLPRERVGTYDANIYAEGLVTATEKNIAQPEWGAKYGHHVWEKLSQEQKILMIKDVTGRQSLLPPKTITAKGKEYQPPEMRVEEIVEDFPSYRSIENIIISQEVERSARVTQITGLGRRMENIFDTQMAGRSPLSTSADVFGAAYAPSGLGAMPRGWIPPTVDPLIITKITAARKTYHSDTIVETKNLEEFMGKYGSAADHRLLEASAWDAKGVPISGGLDKGLREFRDRKLAAWNKQAGINVQQPVKSRPAVKLSALDARRVKELEADIASAQKRDWGDEANKARFIKRSQDELDEIKGQYTGQFSKASNPYATSVPNYGFDLQQRGTGQGIPNFGFLGKYGDDIGEFQGSGDLTGKYVVGREQLDVLGVPIKWTTLQQEGTAKIFRAHSRLGDIDEVYKGIKAGTLAEFGYVGIGQGKKARIAEGMESWGAFKEMTVHKEGGVMFSAHDTALVSTDRFIQYLKGDVAKAEKLLEQQVKFLDDVKKGKDPAGDVNRNIDKLQSDVDATKLWLDEPKVGLRAKLAFQEKKHAELQGEKIEAKKQLADNFAIINNVAEIFVPKQAKGMLPSSYALTPYEQFVYRIDALPVAASAKYESQIKNVLDKTYGVDNVAEGFGAFRARGVGGGVDEYLDTQIKYTMKQERLHQLTYNKGGRQRLALSQAERAEKNKLEKEMAVLKSDWGRIIGAETLMREEGATVLMEPIRYGSGVMYHLMTPTLQQQDNLLPLTKSAWGEHVEDFGGGRVNRAYYYDGTGFGQEIAKPYRGSAVDVVSRTPEGGVYKAGEITDPLYRQMAEQTDPYTKSLYQEVFAARPIPKEKWVGDIYLIEENVGQGWYKPPQMYAMLWKNSPPSNLVTKSGQFRLRSQEHLQELKTHKQLIRDVDYPELYPNPTGQWYFHGIPLDMKKQVAAEAVGDYSVLWLKGMSKDVDMARTTEYLATYNDYVLLRQANPSKWAGKYGTGAGAIDLNAAQDMYWLFANKIGSTDWRHVRAEITRAMSDPNYRDTSTGLREYGKWGYVELDKQAGRIPEGGVGGIWERYKIQAFEDEKIREVKHLENRLRGYIANDDGIMISKTDIAEGGQHYDWYMQLSSPDDYVRTKAEAIFNRSAAELNEALAGKTRDKQVWFGKRYGQIPETIGHDLHTKASAKAFNQDLLSKGIIKRSKPYTTKEGLWAQKRDWGDSDILSVKEGDPVAGTGYTNPAYIKVKNKIEILKEEKDAFKNYIHYEYYIREALHTAQSPPTGIMADRLAGIHITTDELTKVIHNVAPEFLEKGVIPKVWKIDGVVTPIYITDVQVAAINKYFGRLGKNVFQRHDSIWTSSGKQGKPTTRVFDESGYEIPRDPYAEMNYTGLAEMDSKVARLVDMGKRYYAFDKGSTGKGSKVVWKNDYVQIIDDYFREVKQWKQYTQKGRKYGQREGDTETPHLIWEDVDVRHILRPQKTQKTEKAFKKFEDDTKFNESLWRKEAEAKAVLRDQRDSGTITQKEYGRKVYEAEESTKKNFRTVKGWDQSTEKKQFLKTEGGSYTYNKKKQKATPDRPWLLGSSKLEKERIRYKDMQDRWDFWNNKKTELDSVRSILAKPRAIRSDDESELLSKWLVKQWDNNKLEEGQLPPKNTKNQFWQKAYGIEPKIKQRKVDDEWIEEGGGNVRYKEYEENGVMYFSYTKGEATKTKITEPPTTTLDWKHSDVKDIVPWGKGKMENFQHWKARQAMLGGTHNAEQGKQLTQEMKGQFIKEEAKLFNEVSKALAKKQALGDIVANSETVARITAAVAYDFRMPRHPQVIAKLAEIMGEPTKKQALRIKELKDNIQNYERQVSDNVQLYEVANTASDVAQINMKNQMVRVMHKGDEKYLEPQEFEGTYRTFTNKAGETEYVVNKVTGKFEYDIKMTNQPQKVRVMDTEMFAPDGIQPNPNYGKPRTNVDGSDMMREDLSLPYKMQSRKNPDFADYQRTKKEFADAEKAELQAQKALDVSKAQLTANTSSLRSLQGKLKAQGIEQPEDMMAKLTKILDNVEGKSPAAVRSAYDQQLDLYTAQIFGTLKRNFDEVGKFKNAVYSDVYEAVPILRGTDPFGFIGYVGERGQFKLGGGKTAFGGKEGTAFDIVNDKAVLKAVEDYGGWEKLANLVLSNKNAGYGFKGMFHSETDEAAWRSIYAMWAESSMRTEGKMKWAYSQKQRTLKEIEDLKDEIAIMNPQALKKGVGGQLYAAQQNLKKKYAYVKELEMKERMYIKSKETVEDWLVQYSGLKGDGKTGTIAKVVQSKDRFDDAVKHLANAQKKYDEKLAERLRFEMKHQVGETKEETVIEGFKTGGIGDESAGISPFTSGLGDTAFTGQLVKVTAKEFQGKLDLYLDWMHGRKELPFLVDELGSDEALQRGGNWAARGLARLVGAENLPYTTSARAYQTNVFDLGSGWVPQVYRTETKPFLVRMLERMTHREWDMEMLLTPSGRTKTLKEVQQDLFDYKQVQANKLHGKKFDDLKPEQKQDVLDDDKVRQLENHEARLQNQEAMGIKAGGTAKIDIAAPARMFQRQVYPQDIEDAVARLYHSKVREGFMGNLYDKIGGFFQYPFGKKFVKDWTGTRYRYKRKEAFEEAEAGINNITPRHVAQVEQEVGFSLRDYAPQIRAILKEGRVIQKSEQWTQNQYDNWIDQITFRSSRDQFTEALMQNVPIRMKLIQKVVQLEDRMTHAVNRVWTPEKYRGAANVLDDVDDIERSMAIHQKEMFNAEVKLAQARNAVAKKMSAKDSKELSQVSATYNAHVKQIDRANKIRSKQGLEPHEYDWQIVSRYNNAYAKMHKRYTVTDRKQFTPENILGRKEWDSLKPDEKIKVQSIFDEVVDARDELTALKAGQRDLQRQLDKKIGYWDGGEFIEGEFQMFRHGRASWFDEEMLKHRPDRIKGLSPQTKRAMFPESADKPSFKKRVEDVEEIRSRDLVLERPKAQAHSSVDESESIGKDLIEKAKRQAQRDYMENYASVYGAGRPDQSWSGLYQTYVYPPAFASTTLGQQMEKMKLGLQGEQQLIPDVAAFTGDQPPPSPEVTATASPAETIPDVQPTLDVRIQNILAEINTQVQAPAIKGAYETRSATEYSFGQIYEPISALATRQTTATRTTAALRTPLITTPVTRPVMEETPLMRTWFPPAGFMPIVPNFPSYRKRPRMTPPVRGSMRKIWWDVPSQPLGEPWAAREYMVFGKAGVEGEPVSVKEKEYEKDLDAHPFGMGYEDDLKFWSVPDYQRSGFGMGRRGASKDSKKYVKTKGAKMPHQKRIKFKFPDSDF